MTKTIYYTSTRDGGDVTQGPLVCSFSALNEEQLYPDSGAPAGIDVTFRVPSTVVAGVIPSVISGVTPEAGDRITLDGVDYRVLAVSYPQFKGAWVCACRRTFIAADLKDIITIRRRTVSIDAWGSKVPSFTSAESNIGVRIQPVGNSESDQRGKRDWTKLFWLYLPTTYTLNNKDTILDSNSQEYEVESDENAARIDTLQRVLIRVTP